MEAKGGAPGRRPRLVELAAVLAGRQGLATYAVVVDRDGWRGSRMEELSDSMRQHLARRGVDGQVRVQPGETTWAGICELVRTYGYGPLEPDTILLGGARGEDFASVLLLAAERRKNVVVPRSDDGELFAGGASARIDVWWRGKSENASFMLALAVLLQRARGAYDAGIRLCHLVSSDESAADERARLADFLASSRVRAEVVAAAADGDPFARIAEISRGSSVVLMGLRPPRKDEDASSYADYFGAVMDGTVSLPQAVFVRVAEPMHFKNLFMA